MFLLFLCDTRALDYIIFGEDCENGVKFMDLLHRGKKKHNHKFMIILYVVSGVYEFLDHKAARFKSMTLDATKKSTGAQAGKEIFVHILMWLVKICFLLLIAQKASFHKP